jgi:hypothetical protein
MPVGKQRSEPMTVPRSLGLPAVPVWRWYFSLFTTRVGVEMDGQPEPGLVDSGSSLQLTCPFATLCRIGSS